MIRNWMKMLLAILVGNVIYFAVQTVLPEELTHELYKVDSGLILDFGLCLVIYLLLRKL